MAAEVLGLADQVVEVVEVGPKLVRLAVVPEAAVSVYLGKVAVEQKVP